MTMINHFSILIKYLFLIFVVSLIVSICKNEVILNVFPQKYVNVARISSLISSTISNCSSILLIFFIIISTWYILILLNCTIEIEVFIEACQNLIIVFLFGELFKFGLIWIFLNDEVKNFNLDDLDIGDQLSQTVFFKFSNLSNIITQLISVFVFGYILITNNIKIKIIICSTLTISILLLINNLI